MSSAILYRDILTRCEEELQSNSASEAAQGDYPSARLGLELAERIADLRQNLPAEINSLEAKAATPRPTKTVASNPTGSAPIKPPVSTVRTRKSSKKSTKPTTVKTYPSFAREGDKLIKIGWSKRTRKEYQHKAPRPAVDAFAKHLRKRTRDGKIFTIDGLLPVPDPANNGELPGYQVYLVLAWLRSMKVISKHGRNGYSVGSGQITTKALAHHWGSLPHVTF